MVKRYLVTVFNSKIRAKNAVNTQVLPDTGLITPLFRADFTMVKRYLVIFSNSKIHPCAAGAP